jgi:hypothetical protein
MFLSGNNNTNGTLHTRPTDRLLGNTGALLHAFLEQHNETKQILTYASILTFHRQQERSGQDGWKLWLWKIWDVFEILQKTFSKFYNLSEQLATDKVLVLQRNSAFYTIYSKNEHQCFGIKIYKWYNSTGYTYDMEVYLRKDRQCKAHDLTATYATVTELTRKVGRGNKLFMDNFLVYHTKVQL